MKTTASPEIENRLAAFRRKQGLSAAGLARTVGVSRQTIYAIEAGSFVPNTVVALALARALDVGVEDLFALAAAHPAPALPSQRVMLLPGAGPLQPGQPVQLCRVEKRLMASAQAPAPWYFPASDAVVAGQSISGRKTKVQVYRAEGELRHRILVAGCDPAVSVLARHMLTTGVELVPAHRNSSQALALLKQGCVHIAGTHLPGKVTGGSNIPEIARQFPKNDVAVISFAVWEEGLLTARGNPKGIRGVEDFARKGMRIVNREEGSGSRLLLDSCLERLRMDRAGIAGYERLAPGHLPAAWLVHSGAADCCIATRASARLFGLGFIPLVSERYDLVTRRDYLDLPAVQALLDTLTRSAFRRELESIGGYDTRGAGRRIL